MMIRIWVRRDPCLDDRVRILRRRGAFSDIMMGFPVETRTTRKYRIKEPS